MISFFQFAEQLEKSPLMDGGDSPSMGVIQAGKALRKDDESQFWDDFIRLCSNSSGLANLLGVSAEQVRRWPDKIKDLLDKLDTHTTEPNDRKEKTEQIPTGDNGAVTTNSDPQLGTL